MHNSPKDNYLDRQESSEWNRVEQAGPLWERYENYLAFTDEEPPKSFDEWLNT